MSNMPEKKNDITPEDFTDVRKGYLRSRIFLHTARILVGGPLTKKLRIHTQYYKPKHKSFILIANHCEPLDPGYEMIALKKYLRYIAADQLMRIKGAGWALKNIGGVIVKYKDRDSDYLANEVIANVRAGIPVGIHAEGGTTSNGETGFVSEHTGKLVKDSGVALITCRLIGGYLKSPRWAKSPRKGPVDVEIVNEYSPEELSDMTVKEVTELIRKDIYVNVFEEQRKRKYEYTGDDLAEYIEMILYVCPKCKQVGRLHSHGDILECECGYKVRYGTDGFFHNAGSGVEIDNILDWDKWQRPVWKDMLFAAKDGELIFSESHQGVARVSGENKEILSGDAEIRLYKDRIEIRYDDNTITMMMDKIKDIHLILKDSVVIVDDENYVDIKFKIPSAGNKYIAAWRYLTGRAYV